MRSPELVTREAAASQPVEPAFEVRMPGIRYPTSSGALDSASELLEAPICWPTHAVSRSVPPAVLRALGRQSQIEAGVSRRQRRRIRARRTRSRATLLWRAYTRASQQAPRRGLRSARRQESARQMCQRECGTRPSVPYRRAMCRAVDSRQPSHAGESCGDGRRG